MSGYCPEKMRMGSNGRRRLAPLIVSFCVILLVVCGCGISTTTTISRPRPTAKMLALRQQYPPPGKRIKVDGFKLHMTESGSGSPPVVFEAGSGCPALYWSLVVNSVRQVLDDVRSGR